MYIMFFIPKENIDTNIWDIHDGYVHKQSNRKLISGDYIMIQIVDKRINQNDSQIKSIGKLIDFSTPEDVEKYYGNTAKQQIIESKTKYDNEESWEILSSKRLMTIEEVKQRFIEKKNILYYLQNILEVNKNYNIFVRVKK